MIIEDGGFRGTKAKVGLDGRVFTDALQRSIIHESAEHGDAFMVVSDFVELTTTGSFSGIAYLQNTSARRFHIYAIKPCGEFQAKWKLYKNPTTGTLISAGTTSLPVNMNYSSSRTFTGSCFSGADGKTITDGSVIGAWVAGDGTGALVLDGGIILGTGDSLSLSVQPSAAGAYCVTIIGFYDDDDAN